nr:SURF1 family protein [uncultured Roseateles sp.]
MKLNARRLLLGLLAVAGVGLTASLGFWQLDRAAQKQALQQSINTRALQAPLSAQGLSRKPEDAAAQVHLPVRLRGHWLHAQTVFLDNRPMAGRVGFFIVTPLRLQGRSEAILVQRGWLPRNAQERSQLPQLPSAELNEGEVEVQGRLALAPSRVYEFSPAHSGAIRQNLDAAAYAQETKQELLPLTVLQTGPKLADEMPRDWAAPDLGLQKHYGYAFQWFALSALLLGLYVWFQFIRPARAQRPPSHEQ